MKLDFADLPPLTEECWCAPWHRQECPYCKGTGRVPTDFGAAVLDLVRTHLPLAEE